MKTQYISTMLFVMASFLFLSQKEISAQWSIDPSVNMAICDTTGEQTLTKNSPTPDGGVYVSWFDNRAGSYAVYLQKLDMAGNKKFGSTGLLISNNPQSSSLVDYDLATDADGNAILAFTDTRNGSNINPFAYKISPTGLFLWGANGISLGDTAGVYQANPKIVCATDGSYWFTWIHATSPRKIGIQRLNSVGVKQFTPSAIYLLSPTTNENYDWPWPVVSDNGSMILMWSGYTGSFLTAGNYKIYSQKFSSAGAPVWNTSRDTVYSLGRVSGFYTPRIFPDGNNGAVYVWQDDRNATNTTNCAVQRKTSLGSILFPVNGSIVATNTTDALRFAPMAAVMPGSNQTYVFWQQKNSLQSLIGVYGQRFSSSGAPLWSATDGKVFKALDGNSFSSLQAFTKTNRIYVAYLEIGTGTQSFIKSFATDSTGSLLWPGGIITMSTNPSNKIRLWSSLTNSGLLVGTWEDERNDGGGIFGQFINVNGLFILPVELSSFTAFAVGNSVILNWSTTSEKNNNGFFVERKVSGGNWETISFVKGNGTTLESKNYSYADKSLKADSYLYRLKQVDFDGTSEYTKVVEVEIANPSYYAVEQNFPNPFNPTTLIKFTIAQKGNVTLKVFDVIGNEVATLLNDIKEAGTYEVKFNASNLTSGIYFYELNTSSFRQTKKLLLIK